LHGRAAKSQRNEVEAAVDGRRGLRRRSEQLCGSQEQHYHSDRLGAAARGGDENLLDRSVEQFGDPKGERQGRIILPGLDRIDALPRYLDPLGEILLAPGALGAKDPEAIFHQQPLSPRVTLLTTPPIPRPINQAT